MNGCRYYMNLYLLTNSKSEVPSWDSSPNFGLGVFFRNSFSNHPPTHPSKPPGKVFVSYVGGRFLNKSCLSILVGIKNGYCNSWWPKYGPQVPKEWFESIYPLILWQSKTERKLIADWGPRWRCWFINHYHIPPKHHTTHPLNNPNYRFEILGLSSSP